MELSLEKLEQLYVKFGREYGPGSVIFMEDSCGDEMYLILDGEVEVTKTYREFELDRSTRLFAGTGVQTLGILKRGDFFGEMALLNDCPRSATARALTQVKLICIARENFNLIIGSSNPIVLQILRSLSGRLREANRFPRAVPPPAAAEKPKPPAKPAKAEPAQPEAPHRCAQCQTTFPRDTKFCPQCGHRVSA